MSRRRRKPTDRKKSVSRTGRIERQWRVVYQPRFATRSRRSRMAKIVGASAVRPGGPKPMSAVKVYQEWKRIQKGLINPFYSLVSPLRCRKKRALARRDYFGFRSTGRKTKGGSGNRFTVRC